MISSFKVCVADISIHTEPVPPSRRRPPYCGTVDPVECQLGLGSGVSE